MASQSIVTQGTNLGVLSICQKFRKFSSELKWKGPFQFGPTGIFETNSGGGPL